MEDFAALHCHCEQLGALVKLAYGEFALVVEIIAFPDDCMAAVKPLPDFGSNIEFLQSVKSGLFVSGLSPQRRRPCRARLRLQAQTVAQAGSMLPEVPAPPWPAHRIAAHHGGSWWRPTAQRIGFRHTLANQGCCSSGTPVGR